MKKSEQITEINKQDRLVQVGIFWAIRANGNWNFCEIKKSYPLSSANSLGFIDYPYSHYDKWDDVRSGSENSDCYFYPRGRVLYDTNSGKHRIFADGCLDELNLQQVVELFEIDDYELCRDEHYVCHFCAERKQYEKAKLEYNVLRGQDKIGENLIEISYGSTKILVELGKSLDGGDEEFEGEILQKTYSAVIISHYHEDHAGLIKYKHDCPIYIGGGAARILGAMLEYRGEELPKNVRKYYNAKSFHVGGIKVTPCRCDHSAFDSYMLLFEAGGKSILYTGDFRFHGRQSMDKWLLTLPKYVDVLIHEGTNIGKNACTISEAELENKAVDVMKSTNGPVFVLQSGSNIDRLVSIYRASRRSHRLFYMDNYVSLIASAVGGRVPRPDVFGDVVAFTHHPLVGKRKDMFLEIENKRGLKGIAAGTKHFTMLVRPTMAEYVKKLLVTAEIKEATLIYSMWQGYKETEYVAEFLTELQTLGVKVVDLHTSGHASAEDIEMLKQKVKAKQTVCVHTENSKTK